MEVIICVGDSFWILKLCHLEQLRVVLPLHFEEIFTVRVIMSHCTGSRMSSSVLSNSWWLFLTKHFVLLPNFIRSLLPVIIAHNITNWCSRPIWPSVRMSFFGQINWLLLNGKIETRQLIFSFVSSVGCLGSSCRRSGPQWMPVGYSEVVLVSWSLAIVMRCPDSGYCLKKFAGLVYQF